MFSRSEGQTGTLQKYLILLIGAAVVSFGIYNIHSQCSITEGGVIGLVLILNHYFGISPSISTFVLDVACYLLAFKFLGKGFAKQALFSTASVAVFYLIWEQFPPVLPNLADKPLLAALLGGLFVGVGVGFIIRSGGASGGDDALALVIAHLSKCRLAKAYLVTDLIVLVASLSYIPFSKIFYSLITVTVSSFVIDKIHTFGKAEKAIPLPAT